ncbi:MAG: DUF2207 family protein [Gulosibacter sp.]|uniref:DUF2207 family protein n=1 Tax=Gulosibacter sp. TaxID=2817531 RepID=UPI003F92D557
MVLITLPFGGEKVHANVNNFSFSSWDTAVDVSIERGAFGGDLVRSEFTETVVAKFPEHDQNRGLVREIPVSMGHQTMRLDDVSVTDGEGNPIPFERSQERGSQDVMLSIGDDNFVHGETTYVIKYALINTMRYREYSDTMEYAPNLVPPYRAQDIESFSASVRIPEEWMQHVTEVPSHREYEGLDGQDIVCFIDSIGDEQECPVEVSSGDGVAVLSVADLDLGKEAATLRVSFDGNVLQKPMAIDVLSTPQVLSFAGVLLGSVLTALGVWFSVRKRKPELEGPLITRYETEVPPILAGILLAGGRNPARQKMLAASVLFAAVRGVLWIAEGESSRKPDREYTSVRVIGSVSNLPEESRKFLRSVLKISSEGDRRLLGDGSTAIGDRWSKFVDKAITDASVDGYLGHSTAAGIRKWFVAVALLVIVLAAVAVAFLWNGVADDLFGWVFAAIVIGFAAVVWLVVHIVNVKAIGLTAKGKELYAELRGVEQYIALAEIDRLEALQGADTADRDDIDGYRVLDVYEKLLPYAELFGYSTSWASLLAHWYQQTDQSSTWTDSGISQTLRELQTSSYLSATTTTSSSSGGDSSSSYSGGGSAGGGFGGGSVGGR